MQNKLELPDSHRIYYPVLRVGKQKMQKMHQRRQDIALCVLSRTMRHTEAVAKRCFECCTRNQLFIYPLKQLRAMAIGILGIALRRCSDVRAHNVALHADQCCSRAETHSQQRQRSPLHLHRRIPIAMAIARACAMGCREERTGRLPSRRVAPPRIRGDRVRDGCMSMPMPMPIRSDIE